MKKTAVTLFAAAVAATGIISLAATSGDRVNTMIIHTDPSDLNEVGGRIGKDSVLYVNDIDSVVFNTTKEQLWVYGIKIAPFSVQRAVTYDLNLLKSLEFSFLKEGEMTPPAIDVETVDRNSIRVCWKPVKGAAGYEICCVPAMTYVSHCMNTDLDKPDFDWEAQSAGYPSAKVDGDASSCVIGPLDYNTQYCFGIRTLSPKGEGFHSPWSNRNAFFKGSWNYTAWTTDNRGAVAFPIKKFTDRTTDSFTAEFDLTFNESDFVAAELPDIRRNHVIGDDGKFVADKFLLVNLDTDEKSYRTLTSSEMSSGLIKVSGLKSGARYAMTLMNSQIEFEPDAVYGYTMVITRAEEKDPILLTGGSEDNPADLTEFMAEFMTDPTVADGQTYYLQGDRHYMINATTIISKGIRLMTDPADLKSGKRAKFHFGTSAGFATNLMLGQASGTGDFATTLIDNILFKGIDFDVPSAVKYIQSAGDGTANYFINTYSNVQPTEIENFEISDCTFKGFIRGFFRLQGSADYFRINRLTVDGCLFSDCGAYKSNNSDYGWFNSPSNKNYNMFNDFRFTNNTIYDSPMSALISGPTGRQEWADDYHWNIRIENNTFINFSTLVSGKNLIYTRFVPGGSYYSVQRNLIVLADDSADRVLNQGGADIREITGSGQFSFDVKDNYSVGCRDTHLKDDGIFTAQSFSATKNSFGMWSEYNNGTAADLVVKVGTTPLRATDLFTAPNNDPSEIHKAPANIMEALKYRDTEAVRTHEIYTLNIGDQRWK